METLLQDIRFALRMLAKAPVFTVVVTATLALGIGANTAIFTLVNAVLLRPAPYEESERLVKVWTDPLSSPWARNPSSPPDVLSWREQSDVFEELGYFFPRRNYNASGSEIEPRRIVGGRLSANLLLLLRVKPILGRVFLPEEDVEGARTVVMLTYEFWMQHFGGDRGIVGKTLRLDRTPFEIVGVLPADFHLTSPATELWVPFSQEGAVESFGRLITWLDVVARLKPGKTVEDAQARLDVIAANAREQFPQTNEDRGVFVESFANALVWDIETALLMVWFAAGFVLLIACTNVASLMLGRLAERSQEVAVRAAVGAGRGRLIRQFLTEALVLAAMGGAAGVWCAVFSVDPLARLFLATIWSGHPAYVRDVSIDSGVLLFALAATAATGLLFGVLPAIAQSQTKIGARMALAGRIAGRREFLGNSLVVAETALSMILLVGVGLSVSAFLRAQGADVGFDVEGLSVLQIELPRTEYAERRELSADGRQLWHIRPTVEIAGRDVERRLAAIPGVRSVALVSLAPPACCRTRAIEVPEARDTAPDRQWARFQTVSPTYFETMGIPLRRGRIFGDAEASGVAVVNETFAQTYFGEANPLGKTVNFTGALPELNAPAVIVGVAADSLHSPWSVDGARPQLYLPRTGQPAVVPGNMRDARLRFSFLIRSAGGAADIFADARRTVAEALPDIPITKLAPMEQEFAALLGPARIFSRLLGGLSLLALALTAIGLYGVVSYSARQRTREFGVRLALGEERSRLLRSVLARGWRLTGWGALGAYALSRLMENRFFFSAEDRSAAFVVMALVLLTAAALAGYFPARRAARLNPTDVLRHE